MRGVRQTFIGILIETPEGINPIIVAVRHRGIDQTGGDTALGFLDTGAIVRGGPTTCWTGRHQVSVLHCRKESRYVKSLEYRSEMSCEWVLVGTARKKFGGD